MMVRTSVNFRYIRIFSLSDTESGVKECGYIIISTKRRVKKGIQLFSGCLSRCSTIKRHHVLQRPLVGVTKITVTGCKKSREDFISVSRDGRPIDGSFFLTTTDSSVAHFDLLSPSRDRISLYLLCESWF